MVVLGYSLKLKMGLGQALGQVNIFSMVFHKNPPHSILYQLTKFLCHTLFSSQDIKQNVLLSFYLDNGWRHNF